MRQEVSARQKEFNILDWSLVKPIEGKVLSNEHCPNPKSMFHKLSISKTMLEDPFLFSANFDNLQEDTLEHVLSYFPLSDLTTFRQVSRRLRDSCHRRKLVYQKLLIKNKSVQIIGLQSAKGKQLNGRLAIIDGKPNVNNQNRYPVLICHLTGETERLSMKLMNLNPFLNPQQELQGIHRQRFLDYTKDSRVREGHGRFIDKILTMMRFIINNMQLLLPPDDFDSFWRLPRSDPRIAILNSQIFTMYRVKPVDAGFELGTNEDRSLLAFIIEILLDDETLYTDNYGTMARYPPDGVGGRLMVRNFVRFIQAWDKERISGSFWIVKICPTGTLMVKKKESADEDRSDTLSLNRSQLITRSSEFGKVYLVKGMGSTIGENIPPVQLPSLVRMTFLPLYDFLVYDGISFLPTVSVPRSESLREHILAHVNRAVREETVVFCGESASKGLWSEDPPEVNLEEIEVKEEWEGQSYEPSPEELEGAMDLAGYAQSIGFKSSNIEGELRGTDETLVVRRVGYTLEDNPSQHCGVTFDSIPDHVMHFFQFKVWPTYTIMELLPELLKVFKKCKVVPGAILIDEKSLVVPMRVLFKKAFQEIGSLEEIQVKWYPPPSKEDEIFKSQVVSSSIQGR